MTSPQLEPANSTDSPSSGPLPSLPSVDGPATPAIESCNPPLTTVDPKFEMDTTVQEVTQKKYEKSQASEDSEPRHERELNKYGLRPVWTAWDGYPGEVPDDIQKWLDDNGRRDSAQLIGPLSSLLWLGGYDELVAAVDDPSYVLEDEISIVPEGANFNWLASRLFDDGKIPQQLFDRLSRFEGDSHVPITVMPAAQVSNVPAAVGAALTPHFFRDLYPLSRPQCFPEAVHCAKFNGDRNRGRLLSKIRQTVGNRIDGDNLWFRGISFGALIASLTFFIPVIHSHNQDNEFGPGIYTTSSFEYALDYAGNNGAVMVFQAPDLRDINTWVPSSDEWNQLVANWLHLRLATIEKPLPDDNRKADLIRGPIPRCQIEATRYNRLPVQSTVDQMVAVSYAGCAALANSLSMIIYIEP